jgi:hypothetical protein
MTGRPHDGELFLSAVARADRAKQPAESVWPQKVRAANLTRKRTGARPAPARTVTTALVIRWHVPPATESPSSAADATALLARETTGSSPFTTSK